jgi:hypothetical protein
MMGRARALGLSGGVLLCLAGCNRQDKESRIAPQLGGSSADVSASGAETLVARDATPPVSVVWNVGFTENVPLYSMQAMYAKFVRLSELLWTVSEGQVWIRKVRFFDEVAPGSKASGEGSVRTPTLDVLLWPRAQWDLPSIAGYVLFTPGRPGVLARSDRRIQVPEDATERVLLHESSHVVWKLSWSGSGLPPGLDDEYKYLPTDPACIMDLQSDPPRWCSGGSLPSGDHRAKSGGQGSQSCWEQILGDYPNFTYQGSNRAASAPAAPEVEYNDTP